jgi:ferredoxin--NADP+ reductase
VPEGDFTTHLTALEVGNEILVEKASYGFLTLDRFQGGRDLWLLASGTGIAPYISVLQEPEAWERFEHLIVVHSVRHADELAYREEMAALIDHPVVGEFIREAPQRLIHVPLVTRDAPATATGSVDRSAPLHARITTALADGNLEQRAGIRMNHEDSRIMICGNPQMVDDIRHQLMIAGYGVSRSSKPGQIAVENYW